MESTHHAPTRLLGDMTNKVRETSADLVFHEIRVDKDVPDDLGTLGKLRLIYNGISANAWLTPVGIRHIRGATPNNASLPTEVKNSIRDRAASANGIMGRRHFELDRQELGKNEMILGRRMGGDDGGNKPANRRVTQSARRAVSSRKEVRRPNTGYITDTSKRLEIATPFRSKSETPSVLHRPRTEGELPDLCITRLSGGLLDNDIKDKKHDTNGDMSKKRVQIAEDETTKFRSVSAMQEAYRLRTKSAPIQKPAIKGEQGEQPRSNSVLQDVHTVPYRGPMLKPLICNEGEKDADHSMCNETCKGCFRACLASDEYFQKAKSRDFATARQVRLPRKRVPYKLRPALRMAFLEQLVISKQPQMRPEHQKTNEEKHEEEDGEDEG